MSDIASIQIRPTGRTTIRRSEDLLLKEQIDRHVQLFHIGQLITSEINLDILFDVLAEQTIQIMDTQRCSVFLADEKGAKLTAFASTDLKKNQTKMPANFGIAGWVYRNRLPLNVPDAYRDARFYPGIDRLTGFRTNNMLCVPLINRNGECLGTLQTLNKKSGDFTDHDRELFSYLADYVTVAIENAKLYEKLKTADDAKERVINHLSHELKTPLSIISAAFDIIEKKTSALENFRIKKAAQRGKRSVARLMDLQEKVGDIMQLLPVGQDSKVMSLINDTIDILEELNEGSQDRPEGIFDLARKRVDCIFAVQSPRIERISLQEVLLKILSKMPTSTKRNYPKIHSQIANGLFVFIDRQVLEKVLGGLLKNAAENTPDEGRIEITIAETDRDIRIDFRDYGIGISAKNQKNIFSGFFHTHDTNTYSSKHPYEFNAGGAGLDLLRIQAFSKMFDFSVQFESRRCRHIPLDTDLCEGKISTCPHIQEKADCLASGSSIFSITFKKEGRPGS